MKDKESVKAIKLDVTHNGSDGTAMGGAGVVGGTRTGIRHSVSTSARWMREHRRVQWHLLYTSIYIYGTCPTLLCPTVISVYIYETCRNFCALQ